MAASDKELGDLHKLVAKNFARAIDTQQKAEYFASNYEVGAEVDEALVEFLEELSQPNASLLAAAAKFLKDNNITCAVEDNESLTALEQSLNEKKQRRKSVNNVTPLFEIDDDV